MAHTQRTQCVISGGGPAGIMLGFLLARSGIEVTILEKWPDFFRDFRGDTIHPSTMELMYELGLLDEFLALPHQETVQLHTLIAGEEIPLVDFSHVSTHAKFLGFVPQWDFLNFITEHGKQYPQFNLMMETEVTQLLYTNGRVTGVRAQHKDEECVIEADLVVGADGRHSTVREQAQFPITELGAPMDVLWFRLERAANDHTEETLFRVDDGVIFIMINRDTYWQCGYVIPKGDLERIHRHGIDAFRAHIVKLAPNVAQSVEKLQSFDDVKLLSVALDHLEHWSKPGLLMIGDAAHAMSPIAGVGVNLAVQDAVAAANILVPAFKQGTPTLHDLQLIEQRRRKAVRLTQRIQLFIQDHLVARVLATKERKQHVPFIFRLFQYIPFLRRLPARFIGIGITPEHIRTTAQQHEG